MLADLQMPTYQLTTDDLARIHTPCLVVYGSASLTWFRDLAKIVAGAIPDCRLTELVGPVTPPTRRVPRSSPRPFASSRPSQMP